MTVPSPWETALSLWTAKDKEDEAALTFSTPGALARYLDPKTKQTPALDLIDAKLLEALSTPDSRTIITMAPQEGKSVRVANIFPIFALMQNPDLRIITASYGQSLASRNGRSIRNRIMGNPELGIKIADDNGAASEWEIEGRMGGVYSVGIGGGVTGRACDLMIIDDPIKSRAEADSKVYRDRVWDWWTDEASARLAPGAPVVMILTRWHHDDLAGRLLAEEDSDWTILNIPARADHRPEKGETDPLGREPGEYMVSARGRSQKQWEQREKAAGSRTWASLYQGHPTPDTGNLFPVDKWARYTQPLYVVRPDGTRVIPSITRDRGELCQSWDFTFKDTEGSDYVVGQVWYRRGPDAFLLDQVRGRMGFNESVQAMLDMTARWPQAYAKFVEDKANGPAIMNALRKRVGGLIPVEPEGSKYARAVAITPFVESRNVWLPDPIALRDKGIECAWVTDLTDEARDFPGGAHDDTVDALTQAVHRLLLVQIIDDTVIDDEDLYDDDEALPWAASY